MAAKSSDAAATVVVGEQPLPSRVLYVGRIPHGFYEEEMKAYFSQFGVITRLRISRNRRTGAPKHYGFIEFKSAEVAKIAAEAMNNYLLFGHLLQCRVVPTEQVHADTFKAANRKFRVVNWRARYHEQFSKAMEDEGKTNARQERRAKKEAEVMQKLKALGVQLK